MKKFYAIFDSVANARRICTKRMRTRRLQKKSSAISVTTSWRTIGCRRWCSWINTIFCIQTKGAQDKTCAIFVSQKMKVVCVLPFGRIYTRCPSVSKYSPIDDSFSLAPCSCPSFLKWTIPSLTSMRQNQWKSSKLYFCFFYFSVKLAQF